MSLTPVITVDITIDSTGAPRQGFGVELILSHNAVDVFGAERTRSYGATSEVAEDWAADSPEKLAAAAIFAQDNPPEVVKIGKATNAVTQKYEVEVVEAVNAHEYSIVVTGEDFDDASADYTADAATSIAEIHNGLVTALNAVPDKTFTAAFAPLVVADLTFVAEADDETMTAANALVVADKVFTADNTTEIFTAAAHGRATGDGPFQVSNGGGALPTGLAALTDYWFIVIDANTFYLATSLANAIAGTHLSISTNGTGTQTYSDTAETRSIVAHGLVTGDGPIRVSNSGGALPTGLVVATDYYVIKTGTYTFQLATSLALALAGTAINLTTDGTGIQTLSDTTLTVSPTAAFTVTGNAAGNWFSLSAATSEMERIQFSQTHASSGLATELDAILKADPDWYALHILYPSKAYALAAAAWAESNKRILVFDVNDNEAINTAFDIDAVSSTDVLGALRALNYAYTMYSYHQRPSAFFSEAWMGEWIPTDPGEATAALKSLNGVETTPLNSTQLANLEARRGNVYLNRGSRGITWEGKVGNTDYAFIDVTRNVDYLKDGVGVVAFDTITGAPIVGYNRAGIAKVAGAVLGFLTGEATDSGVLDREEPPTVLPPKLSAVSLQDKKDRKLRNVKWKARLTGAIHAADIDGNLSF